MASAAPRTVQCVPTLGGSAAPWSVGAPPPRHRGCGDGPAAARHTARPDRGRGTACASAQPPGSRARPRARSQCSRCPPPRPARCARDAPIPAVRSVIAPSRSGSLAPSRSARSPASAAGPCCSSCCPGTAGLRTAHSARYFWDATLEPTTRMPTALVAPVSRQIGVAFGEPFVQPLVEPGPLHAGTGFADLFGLVMRYAELLDLDPHGAILGQRRSTIERESRTRERQFADPRSRSGRRTAG